MRTFCAASEKFVHLAGLEASADAECKSNNRDLACWTQFSDIFGFQVETAESRMTLRVGARVGM
jgi:hypothetical protein